MNGIRFGGLLMAASCGLFGLRVLWVYRPHDADYVFESLVRGRCSEASPLAIASSSWSGSGTPPLGTLAATGTFAMFGALLFVILASVVTGKMTLCPRLRLRVPT